MAVHALLLCGFSSMSRWKKPMASSSRTHVAAAYLVIDGVMLVGERQRFHVEIEREVVFLHALVLVGNGVVEVVFLVLVEVGQGVAIALDGFFRLAEQCEARAEGQEIVGFFLVEVDVLKQVESALGIVFQKILSRFLDFQQVAVRVLRHGNLHGLPRLLQLVLLRVVVDDVFKLLAVEIDRVVRLQHVLILLDGGLAVLFLFKIVFEIFVVKHNVSEIWRKNSKKPWMRGDFVANSCCNEIIAADNLSLVGIAYEREGKQHRCCIERWKA